MLDGIAKKHGIVFCDDLQAEQETPSLPPSDEEGRSEAHPLQLMSAWAAHCRSTYDAQLQCGSAWFVFVPFGEGGGQENVIIPSNFDKHRFVANADDDLVGKGFVVGAQVSVINKITVKFHDGNGGRKDIQPAQVLTIKGAAEGMPVIQVCKQDDKGRDMVTDWKVNPDNLVLVGEGCPTMGAAAASSKGPGGVPKAMPYLAEGGGVQVVVIQKWNQWQHHTTDDFRLNSVQSGVLFTLSACIDNFPKYTEDDFTIIRRDEGVEVWTKKEFPKGKLLLTPGTSEIKERMYSQQGKAGVACCAFFADQVGTGLDLVGNRFVPQRRRTRLADQIGHMTALGRHLGGAMPKKTFVSRRQCCARASPPRKNTSC